MEEGVFLGVMGEARIFSSTPLSSVRSDRVELLTVTSGITVSEGTADLSAPGTPATAAATAPAEVLVLVDPASVPCAGSVGAASVANEEARAGGAGEGARAAAAAGAGGAGAGVLDPKKEENHPPEDFWPGCLAAGVVGGFWAGGAGAASLGAVGAAASALVAAGTSTDSSVDCATPSLGALSPAFGVTFDTFGVAFTSTEGLGSPADLGVLGTSFSFPSPPCPLAAAAAAFPLMTRMYFPH
mmetsp:Transcript_24121/g.49980  ORF Transcript_24121/g.49980 Transcript_24121/m.49980 type:complete len:242 (-) Transcript_24121:497-1222(-)